MNRIPSRRRLAVGLGAATLAAGASAAVASFASAPAALASDAVSTAAVAPAGSPTASAATSDADNERCELALPGNVLGDPHLTAGSASGLRVWHDASGWHLRATHPGHSAVTYTGVVHSGQPITAHPYRLEPQDHLALSKDHRTLTFTFVDHGAVDGIDLTDRCADHTGFSFRRNGTELSSWNVYLGAHGAHPATDPFTVYRHKP